MKNQFYQQFMSQGINTVIAAIIIAILAAAMFFFLKRNHTSKKHKHRIRSRVIYIAIVIFILVLIRIWIEGFNHLFTMLSLVAAGLVVTNKENIMNFAGWIIINWRDLFAEGEHIQVQNYIGEVIDIKLLYFTISEITDFNTAKPTGKIIKIPNGLIITNPITTFSNDENVILHKIPYVTTFDNKSIDIAQFLKFEMFKLLEEKYVEYINKRGSKGYNNLISKFDNLNVDVEFKLYNDKEKLVNIQTSFYCFSQDVIDLEQRLIEKLVSHISSYPNS
ncbi:mechanosensitive ion channel family protein [Francisellaceae bacterium]|nr:mechanosensitive ion channel family protein [Francisellaceae bacterium]